MKVRDLMTTDVITIGGDASMKEAARRMIEAGVSGLVVTGDEGNVTLSGRLETKSDATPLEDLAKRVDGVVSVKTALTWEVDNTKLEMVSPPPPRPRPNW
ncbi:MAG: CBS domain-containing protein [Acidimicrobiia bacterium]